MSSAIIFLDKSSLEFNLHKKNQKTFMESETGLHHESEFRKNQFTLTF